jgi:hypothetical protein
VLKEPAPEDLVFETATRTVFFPVQVYKNAIHQHSTLVVETLAQVTLTQCLGRLSIVCNRLNAHNFSAPRYAALMFMAAHLCHL